VRRAALIAVVALSALAGCGGGNEEEAAGLLERGFSTDVRSGYLTIDADLELEGVEGFEGPLRLRLDGAFELPGGEPTEVPNLDMDFDLSGAGRELSGSMVLTLANAWVRYGGIDYEVGEEVWARARQAYREQSQGQPLTFAEAGLDPLEWVDDAEVEGEERVSGVKATRVSGMLDVEAMLRDSNELAGSEALPDSVLGDVEDVIEDVEFEAWIGADGIWRRIATEASFGVPEEERDSVGGLEGGKLKLEVELDLPNQLVEMRAPSDPRPIDELLRRLGIPPEALLGPGFAQPSPG
jgi:hypothetical protein